MHTALHEAAARGHNGCVRFILACDFAVDASRSDGLTALHLAIQVSGQWFKSYLTSRRYRSEGFVWVYAAHARDGSQSRGCDLTEPEVQSYMMD